MGMVGTEAEHLSKNPDCQRVNHNTFIQHPKTRSFYLFIWRRAPSPGAQGGNDFSNFRGPNQKKNSAHYPPTERIIGRLFRH